MDCGDNPLFTRSNSHSGIAPELHSAQLSSYPLVKTEFPFGIPDVLESGVSIGPNFDFGRPGKLHKNPFEECLGIPKQKHSIDVMPDGIKDPIGDVGISKQNSAIDVEELGILSGEKLSSSAPSSCSPTLLFPEMNMDNTRLTQPIEALTGSPIPPFLSKTYDLVEDSGLNSVISWAPGGESFVVWDPMEFCKWVLPRHFKHNNFSSFVRQLNTYGFHKIEADRWEFANDGFKQGRRNLLRNIQRRKSSKLRQVLLHVGSSSGVGKIATELENLEKDKYSLVKEVEKLQQENQFTMHQIQRMTRRVEEAELKQKQMVSFLVRVFQNPSLLFRNKNSQKQKEIAPLKCKFLKHRQSGASKLEISSEGQIVKYESDASGSCSSRWQNCSESEVGNAVSENMLHDVVDDFKPDVGVDLHENAGSPPLMTAEVSCQGRMAASSSNSVDAVSSAVDYFVSFPEGLPSDMISSSLLLHPSLGCFAVNEETNSACNMTDQLASSLLCTSQHGWGNQFNYDDHDSEVMADLGCLWTCDGSWGLD